MVDKITFSNYSERNTKHQDKEICRNTGYRAHQMYFINLVFEPLFLCIKHQEV